MRSPQLLLAAAVLVSATATSAATPPPLQSARRAFEAELARQCPARALHNLTPGDLDGFMEGFQMRFSPAQTRQVQDAVGFHCARIEAGLTCANNASLIVYRRLGLLKTFVREVCASGTTCLGFADCARTKP